MNAYHISLICLLIAILCAVAKYVVMKRSRDLAYPDEKSCSIQLANEVLSGNVANGTQCHNWDPEWKCYKGTFKDVAGKTLDQIMAGEGSCDPPSSVKGLTYGVRAGLVLSAISLIYALFLQKNTVSAAK